MIDLAERNPLKVGLFFAALSIVTKLPLVGFGFPHHLNPDEQYILKDPFKLAFMYATGNFSSGTNLLFWVLAVYFGSVFVLGRVLGTWHGFGEFKDLIVTESPTLILCGRVLAVLCAGAGIVVLYRALTKLVPDTRLRLLAIATLALSPIDLVSNAWLKFDGPAFLVNAVVILHIVSYVVDVDDARARRRAYLVAVLACSLRPDFAVVPLALFAFDLWQRRPLRPLVATIATGVAGYAMVTLAPVAFLYRHTIGRGKGMWVAGSFEQNILRTPEGGLTIGDFVSRNLAFYAVVFLAFGPVIIAAFWPTSKRPRAWWIFLGAGVLFVLPLLVFRANGSRYALIPSVYFVFAAALALSVVASWLRYGTFALGLALAGVLSIQASVALWRDEDPRLAAGRYVLAHTRPGEAVAVEGYLSAGTHAEIPECAEELALKAEAVKEVGNGTGETFRLLSLAKTDVCRFILEVGEDDRFAMSSQRGKLIATFASAPAATLPRYFTASTQYLPPEANSHPDFAAAIAQSYELAGDFERHSSDFRLRTLLRGTAYDTRVFVYHRKETPIDP